MTMLWMDDDKTDDSDLWIGYQMAGLLVSSPDPKARTVGARLSRFLQNRQVPWRKKNT